ncbi:MAG: ATP-grasp domain-containing protein [Cyanobacteria bacterium J06632_22]
MGQPKHEARTILLTGSRAPVTLELARQFARIGHRVLVADSLPYDLCASSRAVQQRFTVPTPRHNTTAFIAALRHIIQTEQVDWLIPTCEEVFYISAGRDWLTPYCQVFVEPLAKLKPLHNKWLFIQKIQALGLAVPQTWQVASRAALIAILASNIPERLVIKPVYSRFATQVRFLEKSASVLPSIDLSPANPWVLQAFIPGTHYCLYGIAHDGKLTAFAAYPTLFTAGQGACIYFKAIDAPHLLSWMQTIVAAEQFTGQIAFDVIETEDGTIYPLECNPRAISAVHLFEPSDRLDQAFFGSIDSLIRPVADRQVAVRFAMVLYGLPHAVMTGRLGQWVQAMGRARGAILQWRDPLPGLFLPRMLGRLAYQSLQQRQSLQTVSTQDIEWDGTAIRIEGEIEERQAR